MLMAEKEARSMPRTAGATRRNFHVPLPDDLYRALQAEAEQAQRPANAVARDAIAFWIEQRRQERIDKEIAAYAEAVAGTAEDLDSELEAASLELRKREE
jgi:predicted transcriptional regulator